MIGAKRYGNNNIYGPKIMYMKQKNKISISVKEKAQKATPVVFQETSLGMSGDYIQALEAGATQIRIGTKLFGEKPC